MRKILLAPGVSDEVSSAGLSRCFLSVPQAQLTLYIVIKYRRRAQQIRVISQRRYIHFALVPLQRERRRDQDPGEIYKQLTRDFGEPCYERVDAAASPEQKSLLAKLSPESIRHSHLAGEKIVHILTKANNGAAIGGLKVATENGWFAARPSGTEDIYKIYAESIRGNDHLQMILDEAQAIVNEAFAAPGR